MKLLLRSAIFVLCAAPLALNGGDLRARMANAGDLCRAGEHEAAIAAYTALAADCDDLDDKFNAIEAAARCARLHLRSEARALEICDLLEDEVYRLGCRAVIYQWAGSSAKVLEDLGEVDMLLWPERLAATGFMVRGQTHYREKNAQAAVDDFVRAYQLSTSREKWSALQRLGDTFLNLMDDEIIAEACYRKAMAAGGMGWSGLQSRVNLGHMLIDQGRYDDALQVFNARPDGNWRVQMLLGSARAHQALGARAEALAAIEEALQVPGIQSRQREQAEALRAELSE